MLHDHPFGFVRGARSSAGPGTSRGSTAIVATVVAFGLLAVSSIGAVAQSGSPDPTAPVPSAGPSGGWTYLALGDSNVYGPAEACGSCTTYPHLLADRISTELGIPVRLIDGSQWNSLTSRRLLEEIQQDSWGEAWELPRDPTVSPREAIAAADLITITVAANDQPWFQDPDPCAGMYDQACIDRTVDPYRTNLDGILREIFDDPGGQADGGPRDHDLQRHDRRARATTRRGTTRRSSWRRRRVVRLFCWTR